MVEVLAETTNKGDQHMKKIQRYVGLDVHKDTIVIAVADKGNTGEVRMYGTISSDLHAVERAVTKLRADEAELHMAYEAGPTGFGLYRNLRKMHIDCLAVAPSKMPVLLKGSQFLKGSGCTFVLGLQSWHRFHYSQMYNLTPSILHDPFNSSVSRFLDLIELHQQQRGLLEQLLERGEVARAGGAVDHPVVAGEEERQALADDDPVVLHDRLLHRRADGEDGGVGRVDDGGEPLDAHHAEIGDAERAAGELLGLELFRLGEPGEFAGLGADLENVLRCVSRMTGVIRPSSIATANDDVRGGVMADRGLAEASTPTSS